MIPKKALLEPCFVAKDLLMAMEYVHTSHSMALGKLDINEIKEHEFVS